MRRDTIHVSQRSPVESHAWVDAEIEKTRFLTLAAGVATPSRAVLDAP
jgi:hypothetical protein